MRSICCAALFAVGSLVPALAAPPAKEIFTPYNDKRFTPLARESAETFFAAEEAYKAGEFQTANKTLNQFWKRHPPGTEKWENAYGDASGFATTTGANFGSPAGYYALRMLTDCVRARAAKKKAPDKPSTVTFTVVLVGKSAGVQPRTVAELDNKGGAAVENALDPQLVAKDYAVMRQSMWLFQEYASAITGGKLTVKLEFLPLPQLSVPVHAQAKPLRFAGMTDKGIDAVFAAVPAEVRRRTDWWLLVYPSHVPCKHPPFATTEFVTGGMGRGPDGGSPLFMIDDLWFVRKPPHLGRGDYTEFERRLYLPQWFQHEFFHHLFGTYPDFKLEAKGHQWFDRKTWPADFEGRLEPDYYHEALHKRLQAPKAQPPLELALRYAGPPDAVLKKLTPEALTGTYVRNPRENDYHEGTIEVTAPKKGPPLTWKNKAGISWGLTPDFAAGTLKTGPDNPYFKGATSDAMRAFQLVLARDATGEFLPEVTGFRFNGELYARKK